MRSTRFVRKKLQFENDLCKNPPMTDDLGAHEPPNALTALVSFKVQNVRSYLEAVEFSFLATRLANDEVIHSLGIAGLKDPVKVLPVAGVFGANASGKSCLLQAMSDMRITVIHSFRHGDRTSGIRRRPFLLDNEARQQPSRFEIDLILKGVRWQYGFEINDERVLGEYAYHYPNGRQALVFNRDLDEVRFGTPFRTMGRALMPLLRKNSLLLSTVGAAGNEDIGSLFEWFLNNLRLVDPGSREIRMAYTADLAHSPDMRHRVLKLLEAADLGIMDIKKISLDPDTEERIRRVLSTIDDDSELIDDDLLFIGDRIRFIHEGTDSSIEFTVEDESVGTLVWIGLIGPLLGTLDEGDVLLIDELGASLHPDLVEHMLDLFQNTNTNARCAQLIFNSHGTNVMNSNHPRALGRDQFWLTEKLNNGSTTLTPLAEFKIRRSESIESRYLQGRFGGVPQLIPGEFSEAVELIDS